MLYATIQFKFILALQADWNIGAQMLYHVDLLIHIAQKLLRIHPCLRLLPR
jgi:hypothetical protein